MMFLVFILGFLHLPGNEGASNTKRVFQTPPFIIKTTGESVASEINCSHSITSYDQILWYKQDEQKALKLLGYLNLDSQYPEDDVKEKISFDGDGRKHSRLSVSNLALNDNGVYFCAASKQGRAAEAYFGGGTKLTVLEKDRDITPPTVKVLPPSTKECRNQKDGPRKKTIVCVASGFYPDHVSVKWKIDGIKATSGVATDNAALQEGRYYRITSRLKVSGEDWFTLYKNFTCIVEFFDGTATIPYEDTVLGVEGEEGGMTRENYFKISQTAKLSYALLIIKSTLYGAFVAFLVWKLQSSAGKRNN